MFACFVCFFVLVFCFALLFVFLGLYTAFWLWALKAVRLKSVHYTTYQDYFNPTLKLQFQLRYSCICEFKTKIGIFAISSNSSKKHCLIYICLSQEYLRGLIIQYLFDYDFLLFSFFIVISFYFFRTLSYEY